MRFVFTEDQTAIAAAARELLIDTCAPTDLRRLIDSDAGYDAERWKAIRAIGLIGMLAPEARGGLGLELIDLVAVAEAAGYVALPEPLITQAGLVAPLLARLPDEHGWLARVLDGEMIAVGHPANPCVLHADGAAALLLTDGARLHLVPRGAARLTRRNSFDPLRRLYAVEWTPTPATAVDGDWGDTFARGALLAAAEMVGIAQRAIDMAVAYASDRVQFGKPIGSYQAVKHALANAQVKVEFARPVVHAAALELARDTPEARARLAHARIAASEAADFATRSAVQVHGAMGMTWEADLHFWVKRALALRGAWGTSAHHMAVVTARVLEQPVGPDRTFASATATGPAEQ